MKTSIRTVVIALALAPAAAFAQTPSQPQEGYAPSKIHHPSGVQDDQSRAGAQGATSTTPDSGYGGAAGGMTQSGAMQSGSTYRMMPRSEWRSMYEHH